MHRLKFPLQSGRVFRCNANGFDCDREHIDQETASAFFNCPATRVPRGLLLTETKDPLLSAATYPQRCTGAACHSVPMPINSANPLWEPATIQAASLGIQNWHSTLSAAPLFQHRLGKLWDLKAGTCDNVCFLNL